MEIATAPVLCDNRKWFISPVPHRGASMKCMIVALVLTSAFGVSSPSVFSQSTPAAPSSENTPTLVISLRSPDPAKENWTEPHFSDERALRDRQAGLGQKLQERFLKMPGFLGFASRSRQLKWLAQHCCDIESDDSFVAPQWGSDPPLRRASTRHHHPR